MLDNAHLLTKLTKSAAVSGHCDFPLAVSAGRTNATNGGESSAPVMITKMCLVLWHNLQVCLSIDLAKHQVLQAIVSDVRGNGYRDEVYHSSNNSDGIGQHVLYRGGKVR